MAELFKQEPYMTAGAVIGASQHSTGFHWPLAQAERVLDDTEPAQLINGRRQIQSTTLLFSLIK